MTGSREKLFRRDMMALDSLLDFISEFVTEYKIDTDAAYTIKLAVEEIFTNLVKYDASAAPEIPVRLFMQENRAIVVVTNRDGHDFDVAAARGVDVTQPLKKRQVGGLGLHLVKNLVDELRYEYKDGVSTITIIKTLEENRA